VPGVEKAVSRLKTALGKLAAHVIAPRDEPAGEELVTVTAEVVTAPEWTEDEIVEQVQLEKQGNGDGDGSVTGGHVIVPTAMMTSKKCLYQRPTLP